MPAASLVTVQISPLGSTATSRVLLATSMPTNPSIIPPPTTVDTAPPCVIRAWVPRQLFGLGTIQPVAPQLTHGLSAPGENGLPPAQEPSLLRQNARYKESTG